MMQFVKSTKCETGACVEVALGEDRALVRNSTQPGTVNEFPKEMWEGFVAAVRQGTFDFDSPV
jgi:hypothetical protein